MARHTPIPLEALTPFEDNAFAILPKTVEKTQKIEVSTDFAVSGLDPGRAYRVRVQFTYEHDDRNHSWVQEKKGLFSARTGAFPHKFLVPYRCKYSVFNSKGDFVCFKRVVVTRSKLVGSVVLVITEAAGSRAPLGFFNIPSDFKRTAKEGLIAAKSPSKPGRPDREPSPGDLQGGGSPGSGLNASNPGSPLGLAAGAVALPVFPLLGTDLPPLDGGPILSPGSPSASFVSSDSDWDDEGMLYVPATFMALDDEPVGVVGAPAVVERLTDSLTSYMVDLGYLQSSFAMDVAAIEMGSCRLWLRIRYKRTLEAAERIRCTESLLQFLNDPCADLVSANPAEAFKGSLLMSKTKAAKLVVNTKRFKVVMKCPAIDLTQLKETEAAVREALRGTSVGNQTVRLVRFECVCLQAPPEAGEGRPPHIHIEAMVVLDQPLNKPLSKAERNVVMGRLCLAAENTGVGLEVDEITCCSILIEPSRLVKPKGWFKRMRKSSMGMRPRRHHDAPHDAHDDAHHPQAEHHDDGHHPQAEHHDNAHHPPAPPHPLLSKSSTRKDILKFLETRKFRPPPSYLDWELPEKLLIFCKQGLHESRVEDTVAYRCRNCNSSDVAVDHSKVPRSWRDLMNVGSGRRTGSCKHCPGEVRLDARLTCLLCHHHLNPASDFLPAVVSDAHNQVHVKCDCGKMLDPTNCNHFDPGAVVACNRCVMRHAQVSLGKLLEQAMQPQHLSAAL